MRSMKCRLGKLEQVTRLLGDRCPHCPPPGPIALVEVDQAGNLLAGAYPPRCPRCGGPHGGVHVIEFVRPVAQDEDKGQA
jgi:hypothetical protein